MYIRLPEKVKYIMKALNHSGYEAFAVGGCIRDSIMGREPEDWDITTSATPCQVKGIFDKTIDTGILHGTVTVLLKQEGFEVTTYRIDGKYEDGRHPEDVIFTGSLIEDLKRRDFTINAMAYNDEAGLIDIFGGASDINKKKIKCVGNATERFQEDALRMLRGIRFAAQLDFDVEKDTLQAIRILSQSLEKISAERIQVELMKLLTSMHPEKIHLIGETGLSSVFLPELDSFLKTIPDGGDRFFKALNNVPGEKPLRLAMLLHDIAWKAEKARHGEACAGMSKVILQRLRMDNDTIEKVYQLILWHEDTPLLTPRNIRGAVHRIGTACYPGLFIVKRGIAMSLPENDRKRETDYINEYERIYQKILENQECLDRKELAVNGRDLIEAGIRPGKELGDILDRMLALVIEHPEYNKKETLLEKCLE